MGFFSKVGHALSSGWNTVSNGISSGGRSSWNFLRQHVGNPIANRFQSWVIKPITQGYDLWQANDPYILPGFKIAGAAIQEWATQNKNYLPLIIVGVLFGGMGLAFGLNTLLDLGNRVTLISEQTGTAAAQQTQMASTPVLTWTPTATPTDTATVTFTPTPTSSPTFTASPTNTLTATPTPLPRKKSGAGVPAAIPSAVSPP